MDDDSVSPQIRLAAAWAWRLLVICAAVYVAFRIVRHLELLFIIIFVSLALTALLLPLRRIIERTAVGRAGATALSLILGIIFLTIVFMLLGQSLANQWGDISDQFVEGIDQARNWLRDGPLHVTDARFEQYVNDATDAINKNRGTLVNGAVGATSTVLEVASAIFLTLFTTIFFLYDGERIWGWVVNLLPRSAHQGAHEAGALGWSALTGYVRGTVIIALVDATTIGVGIWIVGVPLALPLGVLVFFGAFVPIVGATVTGAIAVAVALATDGVTSAVIVLIIIIAVQQIEGHLLQPLVMGRLVHVHPLGVVLTVTAGSLVAGIVGAIVAVPVAAVATSVLGYYGRRARAANDQLESRRARSRPIGMEVIEAQTPDEAGREDLHEQSADNGLADDADQVSPTT